MGDALFGRKRMNNEANIETLRSPPKATDFLPQLEFPAETVQHGKSGLTQRAREVADSGGNLSSLSSL